MMTFLYFILFLFSFLVCLIGLFSYPKRSIGHSFTEEDKIRISPVSSFLQSLSGSLGTGNIIGIGVTLFAFGPGVLFWMWIQAIFGSLYKFYETFYTLKTQQKKGNEKIGGPMIYLKKCTKKPFFSILYSVIFLLSTLSIGNMIQSRAIGVTLEANLKTPLPILCILFILIFFFCVVKGNKRITHILDYLVPIMAGIFLVGSFMILFIEYKRIPIAFSLIFYDAFHPSSLVGGSLFTLIKYGFIRGMFTNEAGLGSGGIAHGASSYKSILKSSILESLTPLVDTIIMCTITAIVILVSPLCKISNTSFEFISLSHPENYANEAFIFYFQNQGKTIMSLSILLFATASMLGWYYFGFVAYSILFPKANKNLYLFLYLLFAGIGFLFDLDFLWQYSDFSTVILSVIHLSGLSILIIKDSLSYLSLKILFSNNPKKYSFLKKMLRIK